MMNHFIQKVIAIIMSTECKQKNHIFSHTCMYIIVLHPFNLHNNNVFLFDHHHQRQIESDEES